MKFQGWISGKYEGLTCYGIVCACSLGWRDCLPGHFGVTQKGNTGRFQERDWFAGVLCISKQTVPTIPLVVSCILCCGYCVLIFSVIDFGPVWSDFNVGK